MTSTEHRTEKIVFPRTYTASEEQHFHAKWAMNLLREIMRRGELPPAGPLRRNALTWYQRDREMP